MRLYYDMLWRTTAHYGALRHTTAYYGVLSRGAGEWPTGVGLWVRLAAYLPQRRWAGGRLGPAQCFLEPHLKFCEKDGAHGLPFFDGDTR